MTDSLDQAQRLEERERETGIAVIRGEMARPASGFSRCIDCRDPIEEERRQAVPTAVRCLECQEALERHRNQFAGVSS